MPGLPPDFCLKSLVPCWRLGRKEVLGGAPQLHTLGRTSQPLLKVSPLCPELASFLSVSFPFLINLTPHLFSGDHRSGRGSGRAAACWRVSVPVLSLACTGSVGTGRCHFCAEQWADGCVLFIVFSLEHLPSAVLRVRTGAV